MHNLTETALVVLEQGDLVEELVGRAFDRAGGTFNLIGGPVVAPDLAHLWAVGRPSQSMACGAEIVSTNLVEAWARSVLLLDPVQDTFGVWYDRDTGLISFDAIDLFQDEEDAVLAGRDRKQTAIYDIVLDIERIL